MAIALLLLAAAVAVAGLALAAIGLRGRRVDAHPHCRRCGYDLAGTPDATVCTECGRDLTAERAVRHGTRRRRGRFVAAGVALLLLGLAGVGGLGYDATRDVDWQRHKPQWWLRQDLVRSDVAAVEAAMDELLRRHDDPAASLSPASLSALVDATLDQQADPKRRWNRDVWGGFVETAREAGDVTDAQWGRFAVGAIAPRLEVRSSVRRGDPLPATITYGAMRGGPTKHFAGLFLWQRADAEGREMTLPKALGRLRFGDGLIEITQAVATADGDVTAALPVGRVTVTADVRVQAVDADGPAATAYPLARAADPLGEADLTLTATARLWPADAPSPASRVDPELRPRVLDAISVGPLVRDGEGYTMDFRATGFPTRAIFDVHLRLPDATDVGPLDRLHLSAGGGMWGKLSFAADGDVLEGYTTVDVLFRPDVEAALESVDADPIWGETVILPGVPILHGPDADVPPGWRSPPAEALAEDADARGGASPPDPASR